MKKLVIAGIIALTVSASTPASADVPAKGTTIQKPAEASSSFVPSGTIRKNTDLMNKAFVRLNKTVGKTWYVFSGATPNGWDCSGLTMWFYGELGINLEHRASAQQKAGKPTNSPILGDIVVFKYKGSKTAYHVGIYIGDGKMIHAPREGQRTAIESIADFGGNYSKISYRRIVDTLNG